jgi:hypothetical protein
MKDLLNSTVQQKVQRWQSVFTIFQSSTVLQDIELNNFFFGKIEFNILTTFLKTIKFLKKILKMKDFLMTFFEKIEYLMTF